MRDGLDDLMRMIRMPQLVLFMAWSDIRARYKRSVLGPLWITLGTAISVVALGFIWSELFKLDRTVFVPMLTIGLITWQFMSGCILESTSLFLRQAGIIKNVNLPLSLHPAQLLLRHFINLAHNIPLFFIVALAMGTTFTLGSFLALPAFLIVGANIFWMSLLIGMLGARFRDLEYLITMIMPLLMFVSPVMYRPKSLPYSGQFIWFNPFSDFIEFIRYPLLGEPVPNFIIWANLGILIVGFSFTLFVFGKYRHRIAFWI